MICKRNGIDPVKDHEKMTYKRVRSFLKSMRYSGYFKNIPQIRSRLTRQPPVTFSSQQKETLISIFNEIQEPFEEFRGSRKNFLSYSYTIYKLCELLGYDEFMPMLQLLKAPQNLLKTDQIWKQICNKLGYEFIETR